MRIIFLFLTIAMLASCSHQPTKKQSEQKHLSAKEVLRKSAEKGLYNLIDEIYPHGDDAKPDIYEKKVRVNDDSIYYARFKMKYQNKFGGFSRGNFCYVYVLNHDGTFENGLLNTDEHDLFDFNLFFLAHCQEKAKNDDELHNLVDDLTFYYQQAREYCKGAKILMKY